MITLKTLRWSNLFSYGKDNVIQFDANPITQLVGKNGHGKSSIALVLEEGLYNKNSKGIKKTDILNRHIKDKSYSIELDFDKDGVLYTIKTTRGSTQTVTLYKDGENISSHTATGTFKLIEEIIGLDHKAFSQLVYQSSASSLEFLVATDTNRKKFLIELLNLTRYLEAFEVFKKACKEISEEVVALEASIKTTQSWIDKSSDFDFTEKPYIPEVELDPKLEQELADSKLQQATILDINRRIAKNNQYRLSMGQIDLSKVKTAPTEVNDISGLSEESGSHKKVIKDADALISKIGKLNGTCPTCLQQVDRAKLDELIEEQVSLKTAAKLAVDKIDAQIAQHNKAVKEYTEAQKLKAEWESYHALVDPEMSSDLLDYENLEAKILELNATIASQQLEVKRVSEANRIAQAHNAKISVVSEQMDSMKNDLQEYAGKLSVVSEKLSMLQILQKTFSTSGLIAYKIECMIKDLEDLSNEYLAELSDGRFQLTFVISSSDKLNVVINDNGNNIDILALSGGERARVNTATLLAIRKLMQSLSSTRINLLVLDETVEALDIEGKERLVEVLIKEEHLNTFLVSHGYSHPLLEKITIIKENNISRLE